MHQAWLRWSAAGWTSVLGGSAAAARHAARERSTTHARTATQAVPPAPAKS